MSRQEYMPWNSWFVLSLVLLSGKSFVWFRDDVSIRSRTVLARAAKVQVVVPVNEWYGTRGTNVIGTGPEAEVGR